MERSQPLKLGVLVSGRGTNLQAILDAITSRELDAEVKLVVCNHFGVQAIERAQAAGVHVEVHELREYPSRLAQQRAIAARLAQEEVELVVCAGWDRVLHAEVVRQFTGRVINIHPSLLPAFGGGLHAVKDALQYGVKVTGCTVHFVTEEVDEGPIIAQAAVPILPGDTEETLAERIHGKEHSLLITAIRLYSEDRLHIAGRTVNIKNAAHANHG